MQEDDLHLYGILILEEDGRESAFRRLGYETCLMTNADWDGAVSEVFIMK